MAFFSNLKHQTRSVWDQSLFSCSFHHVNDLMKDSKITWYVNEAQTKTPEAGDEKTLVVESRLNSSSCPISFLSLFVNRIHFLFLSSFLFELTDLAASRPPPWSSPPLRAEAPNEWNSVLTTCDELCLAATRSVTLYTPALRLVRCHLEGRWPEWPWVRTHTSRTHHLTPAQRGTRDEAQSSFLLILKPRHFKSVKI